MKKMPKKHICILIIAIMLAASALTIFAGADFGSFSGSSDYGGSSGGSSWSGGSSSYYSNDYGYDSGSSSGGGSWGSAAFVIVVIIVIIALSSRNKNTSTVGGGAAATSAESLSDIRSLIAEDPNFSEADIKEKISNLYIRMQSGWQKGDISDLRPLMTDALYTQAARQLDDITRSGCTNYVERVAVLDVTLTGWSTGDTHDSLFAILNTRIVDYTKNNSTGKIVSGSNTAEKFMTYEWELIRSKGMKTPAADGKGSEGTATLHCPSCGAPVEINKSAKCPYCDSIISAKDYDWVLSSIKGIAQRTGN